MAITKITAPSSIPATVADYQAQNSHLMAFINQINSQAFIISDPNGTTAPTIKQGAYISHGGSLYIVDTADATISGSPSDGTVYIRVSGTDTLTAEYVTDISSYAWNSAYNAMISGSYTLLPYMLIKSGTSWTKYRFEQHNQSLGTFKSLNVADNITLGGTVDGHDIDGELDTLNGRVNQAVNTTSSPTFEQVTMKGGGWNPSTLQSSTYSIIHQLTTTDFYWAIDGSTTSYLIELFLPKGDYQFYIHIDNNKGGSGNVYLSARYYNNGVSTAFYTSEVINETEVLENTHSFTISGKDALFYLFVYGGGGSQMAEVEYELRAKRYTDDLSYTLQRIMFGLPTKYNNNLTKVVI
jgi:hypothetical protein